jgi:hypothetical protein
MSASEKQLISSLHYGAIGQGEEDPELVRVGDLSVEGSERKGDNWQSMNVLDNMKSNGNEFKAEESSTPIRLAINASWAVNWFLLGAKLFAVIVSSSKAVTAALADSAVDLASQAILSVAARYIVRHSPNYPVGRSRLEALSVIGCAFIMCMASIEGK